MRSGYRSGRGDRHAGRGTTRMPVVQRRQPVRRGGLLAVLRALRPASRRPRRQALGWGPSGTPAPVPPLSCATQTRSGRQGRRKIVVGVGRRARRRRGSSATPFAPHYHVPESIGMQPRMHDAATDRFESDMRPRATKSNVDDRGGRVRHRRAARHAAGARERPDRRRTPTSSSTRSSTGSPRPGVTIDRSGASTGSYAGRRVAMPAAVSAGRSMRSRACGARTRASG